MKFWVWKVNLGGVVFSKNYTTRRACVQGLKRCIDKSNMTYMRGNRVEKSFGPSTNRGQMKNEFREKTFYQIVCPGCGKGFEEDDSPASMPPRNCRRLSWRVEWRNSTVPSIASTA